MPCEEAHTGGQPSVRKWDAQLRRDPRCCGDPRHHMHSHAALGQEPSLLAAAPKDIGVAALEAAPGGGAGRKRCL